MAGRNDITIHVDVPRGFRRGLGQVKLSQAGELRSRMMEALGWKAQSVYLDYLNGNREPVRSQAMAIEKVFAEFGVTSDVWGQ